MRRGGAPVPILLLEIQAWRAGGAGGCVAPGTRWCRSASEPCGIHTTRSETQFACPGAGAAQNRGLGGAQGLPSVSLGLSRSSTRQPP